MRSTRTLLLLLAWLSDIPHALHNLHGRRCSSGGGGQGTSPISFSATVKSSNSGTLPAAPPLAVPVYIEHTDAFGVMFYAHYPVIAERVMRHHYGDDDMVIRGFKTMKYKRPAVLGDIITSRLTVESAVDGCFHIRLAPAGGSEGLDFVTVSKVKVSSRAEIQLLPPDNCHSDENLKQPSAQHQYSNSFIFTYEVHSDELCNGRLSTRTIFSLFERGRTDILGGPAALEKGRADSAHLYVSRVEGYRWLFDCKCGPQGRRLRVASTVTPVGESMATFSQQLQTTHGVTLAAADVSVVCFDSTAGRLMAFSEETRRKIFPGA